jgi:hypothetical protein
MMTSFRCHNNCLLDITTSQFEGNAMMNLPSPDMLKVLHEEHVRRLTPKRWSAERYGRNRRELATTLHFDRHGRLH